MTDDENAAIDAASEAAAQVRHADFVRRGKEYAERVDRILRLHIGLIDKPLAERTGMFLSREQWLHNDDRLVLTDKMILLIAKAVAEGD